MEPVRGEPRQRIWVAAFAALLGVGLVGALVLSGPGAGPPPVPTPTPTMVLPVFADGPEQDPERADAFGGVHALVVADGALLVASGSGLWRIESDGVPRRIGPDHDLRALAAADGELLASGLRRRGEAAPLGLVHSDDGGQTWRRGSLSDAVLVRLRIAHRRIYAWDAISEQLLVRPPGGGWEPRASAVLFDVIVSPLDPEHLVATFPEEGSGIEELRESRDGGATWSRLAAPALALLEWTAAERLWGLTPDGSVFLSEDAGRSWSPRTGPPGPVTAFVDAGDALFAALPGFGIYQSTDDASTWRRIDHPTP